MSNQFSLMRERRFKPFFWTQFLGAFNDNVFKTALITLVAFHAASLTTIDGATLATLLPGLFILPFFLFSATAGQLADKFEKSKIIRFVKVFEIFNKDLPKKPVRFHLCEILKTSVLNEVNCFSEPLSFNSGIMIYFLCKRILLDLLKRKQSSYL